MTHREVKSIIAKCHYENIPSQNLVQKLQFTFVGEEDEMNIYQLYFDEHPLFKAFKCVIIGVACLGAIIPLSKKLIKRLVVNKRLAFPYCFKIRLMTFLAFICVISSISILL